MPELREAVATGDYSNVQGIVDGVLAELGYIGIDREDVSYFKVRQAIARAFIKAWDLVGTKRARGEEVPTPQNPLEREAQPANTGDGGHVLLSHGLRAFLDEHEKRWTPKTYNDYRAKGDLLIDFLGDRPMAAVGRADAIDFRDRILKRLPANWTKLSATKGLKVAEAADAAERAGLAPMSDTNISKYVNRLGQMFNWAVEDRDHWGVLKNPFKGLQVKTSRLEEDERDPFTSDQLKAIFGAPIFTGCASERGWRHPGDLIPRRSARYWIPLLGLYQGARVNELAQLYLDDIVTREDIVGLRIDTKHPGQSVKNKRARRFSPLHPEVIRLGFLRHVETMRKAGEERVFPDLSQGADGYYSSNLSRWFNEGLLPAVGAKTDKTSFHSLRHNFEDALKEAQVYDEWISRLQGHKVEGMAGRYGSGGKPAVLLEAISKVHYPPLEGLLEPEAV